MNWLGKLFSDSSEVSTTRIQSMMLIVVGIGISIAGFVAWWMYNKDLTGIIGLAGMLIGTGVTGKAIQNVVTNKQ